MISKYIIDAAVDHQLEQLKYWAIVLVIILIAKLLITRYTSVISTRTKIDMKNKYQKEIIESYFYSDWLMINQYKTGDLIFRATSDLSNILGILLGTIPGFIALVIQLITAYILLSNYSRSIASIAFIIGPATFVISWGIGYRLKALQKDILEATSEVRSFINENIQNNELIKTYQIEDEQISKLGHLQQIKKDLTMKKTYFKVISKGIIELGFKLGFLGATLIGAYKLYLGEISFGTFTAFSQLVAHIQSPMYGLTKTLPSFLAVLSSIERINEVTGGTYKFNKKKNIVFDSLHLENVSFGYQPKHKVINNFNYEINIGDKIAIIGPSGKGKTTLIRLLLSLVTPDEGSIYFNNNKNIKCSQNTRNLFSYIPQHNTLFTGSIIDNLKLANENASEDDIVNALKTACIYDHIMTLEDGLETLVGERLRGLSEGQAQRICIARALVHNTPILILDEATSALDQETEIEIIKNIEKYYKNKTIVAVTHRKEILSICNKQLKI